MALPKRVKNGGSYYKGYALTVTGSGNDTLDMDLAAQSVVNGLSITPSEDGSGDTFKLEHQNAAGTVIETLAEDIYNIGAKVAILFDFAALEKMEVNDKLVLTYTSVAEVAMTVHVIVEHLK